jgi:hypothetical protein
MFNRNEPVMPVFVFEPGGTCQEYPGLTKFEQCAKDFTAAFLCDHSMKIEDAVRGGILAAEEFCRQMEEREK